jgi:hypothetical protein
MKKTKKTKSISLVVYHSEYNNAMYLAEILKHMLGIHITQAEVCANIVIDRGSYICKTYSKAEYDKAVTTVQLLADQEVPAELIL